MVDAFGGTKTALESQGQGHGNKIAPDGKSNSTGRIRIAWGKAMPISGLFKNNFDPPQQPQGNNSGSNVRPKWNAVLAGAIGHRHQQDEDQLQPAIPGPEGPSTQPMEKVKLTLIIFRI